MNFPTRLLGTLMVLTATTDLASAQSVRLSARTGAGVAISIGTRIDACGKRASVLIRAGNWRLVEQPGHYETRWVEVWVDGYWKIVR